MGSRGPRALTRVQGGPRNTLGAGPVALGAVTTGRSRSRTTPAEPHAQRPTRHSRTVMTGRGSPAGGLDPRRVARYAHSRWGGWRVTMRERQTSARVDPVRSADGPAPLSAGAPAPTPPDDLARATASADAAPGQRAEPRPDLFELLFGDDALAEPPLPDLPDAAPARLDPADPFARASGADPFASADPDPFAASRPALAGDGAFAAATRPADASPAGAFTNRPAPGSGQRGPAPDDETRRISRSPAPAPSRPLLPARLARHRRVLAAAVLAAVAAVPVQLVAAGHDGAAVEHAFAAELAAADDRLATGRIAAPAGDAALDHLEAARGLLPEDGRLTSRARSVAGTLEALGEHALARGDLLEARAHFTGALRADPGRPSVRAKLETIARIAPRPAGAGR